VSRPATKPGTGQRRVVERARRLAAAADQGTDDVGLLGWSSESGTVYPYAFGSAMAQMRDLLAILDELAPAQSASGTAGGAR
jgi:hypothetical protein